MNSAENEKPICHLTIGVLNLGPFVRYFFEYLASRLLDESFAEEPV